MNTTNKKEYIGYGLLIFLTVILGVSFGFHGNTQAPKTGGIAINQSYQSFSTSTLGVYPILNTPGVLHAITINTAAAGAISIYDEATTTPYCPHPPLTPSATSSTIGTLKASAAEQTYFYDVTLSHGLCIVGAAGTDITVTYSR